MALLIGEEDPQLAISLLRVIGAAVLGRRMGWPLPPALRTALEDLETRQPAFMARLEGRALHLTTHTGP